MTESASPSDPSSNPSLRNIILGVFRGRWLWGLLIIFGIGLIGASVGIWLDSQSSLPETERKVGHFGIFFLVNFNVVVVLIIGFLVLRNIVRLVLDLRSARFGARLRTRLVSAFVALSLVPTLLMFTVARGILDRVLSEWFSPQVASAVEGATEVAKLLYKNLEDSTARTIDALSTELESAIPLIRHSNPKGWDERSRTLLLQFIDERRTIFNVDEIALYRPTGELVIAATSRGAPFPPYLPSIVAARRGTLIIRPEHSLSDEYLRGYRLLHDDTGENIVLVVTDIIPRETTEQLTAVLDASDDYRERASYRQPLASSYLLTLVIVALMVVFSAIWVGFYLARRLIRPIQALALGTEEVARGNLDVQIPSTSQDEFQLLIQSFNTMTSDLKQMTDELVSRRQSIETILSQLTVGVIAVDADGRISAGNPTAREMLHISESSFREGEPLLSVVPSTVAKRLHEIMTELATSADRSHIENISLSSGSGTRHLQVSVTKLMREKGGYRGVVILLDDLSELVRTQRLSAWREVARRIAHEIKNPLTPIKLSAQRLVRRFSPDDESISDEQRTVVRECASMIETQVDSLRRLVDEFTRFARMPKSELQQGDLNSVVRDAVKVYSEAHEQIPFHEQYAANLPPLLIDQGELQRALINLLDNAVAAIGESAGERRISVETLLGEGGQSVEIIVSDTGAGISDEDKARLFEPYFSRRKGGTGLGLAIVHSIVADHGGMIKVFDNHPSGSVFLIVIPIRHRSPSTAAG